MQIHISDAESEYNNYHDCHGIKNYTGQTMQMLIDTIGYCSKKTKDCR